MRRKRLARVCCGGGKPNGGPTVTKAIGYIRVSTEEQGASGLGLEAQRAAIGKAAQDMGAKLAFVHEDVGVSGARDVEDREGLTVALGQLERGDVLLVAKRD
ncbi:MAG: recombinase family protein, partial [Salinibacterium sp.]